MHFCRFIPLQNFLLNKIKTWWWMVLPPFLPIQIEPLRICKQHFDHKLKSRKWKTHPHPYTKKGVGWGQTILSTYRHYFLTWEIVVKSSNVWFPIFFITVPPIILENIATQNHHETENKCLTIIFQDFIFSTKTIFVFFVFFSNLHKVSLKMFCSK